MSLSAGSGAWPYSVQNDIPDRSPNLEPARFARACAANRSSSEASDRSSPIASRIFACIASRRLRIPNGALWTMARVMSPSVPSATSTCAIASPPEE